MNYGYWDPPTHSRGSNINIVVHLRRRRIDNGQMGSLKLFLYAFIKAMNNKSRIKLFNKSRIWLQSMWVHVHSDNFPSSITDCSHRENSIKSWGTELRYFRRYRWHMISLKTKWNHLLQWHQVYHNNTACQQINLPRAWIMNRKDKEK